MTEPKEHVKRVRALLLDMGNGDTSPEQYDAALESLAALESRLAEAEGALEAADTDRQREHDMVEAWSLKYERLHSLERQALNKAQFEHDRANALQEQLKAERRDRKWWAANNSRERQRLQEQLGAYRAASTRRRRQDPVTESREHAERVRWRERVKHGTAPRGVGDLLDEIAALESRLAEQQEWIDRVSEESSRAATAADVAESRLVAAEGALQRIAEWDVNHLDHPTEIAAAALTPPPSERQPAGGAAEAVTHGRHCPCSACAREDWTRPDLAPCGLHGPACPPEYAPWVGGAAEASAGVEEGT